MSFFAIQGSDAECCNHNQPFPGQNVDFPHHRHSEDDNSDIGNDVENSNGVVERSLCTVGLLRDGNVVGDMHT